MNCVAKTLFVFTTNIVIAMEVLLLLWKKVRAGERESAFSMYGRRREKQ